jgi:hypothetical protein
MEEKFILTNDDGSIPKDNPFVILTEPKEAIYTYGNRSHKGCKKTLQRELSGT